MGALSGNSGLGALSALVGSAIAPILPFVTRWNTQNSGVTANNQIRIPLVSALTYNCLIDWGDGVIEPWAVSTNPTHTYATPGIYTVSITGIFPAIRFENGGDRRKIISIEAWGTIAWQTFRAAFWGCSNLQINATDGLTANTGAVTDAVYFFRDCTALNNFPAFNTSTIEDLSYGWYNCPFLTSFPAIDTSNCVTLNFAWAFCSRLATFPAINTGNVTDFRYAWQNCPQLTTFPLIDTSSGILFDNTWENSPITNFPLIDMSSAVQCGSAWRGCRTPIFPPIDLSNATILGSCFIQMPLTTQILATGIKASFSLFGCALDAAALNDLYNRLDTVSGETITVTNNPGTSGDDPTIATAKGWTVTGS
jgi:PKD repeat protein